jgi:hypothetical protein
MINVGGFARRKRDGSAAGGVLTTEVASRPVGKEALEREAGGCESRECHGAKCDRNLGMRRGLKGSRRRRWTIDIVRNKLGYNVAIHIVRIFSGDLRTHDSIGLNWYFWRAVVQLQARCRGLAARLGTRTSHSRPRSKR